MISSSKWDSSWKVKLLYVQAERACWGLLPSIPVVDGGAAYVHFCSLERCLVSSHAKQKVPVESRKMGWYLEAGGSARAGACLEIFFPAGLEGPIGESAKPLLVGERGLKLTFGQWWWLFNEWSIRDVGSLDDSLPSVAERVVSCIGEFQ